MLAPGGLESMTTRPLVEMAGSIVALGGGRGVAGGASLAGGGVPAGAGGGGTRAFNPSRRVLTSMASFAFGSACRYFSKNAIASGILFAFSYDPAALNRKAPKGLRS